MLSLLLLWFLPDGFSVREPTTHVYRNQKSPTFIQIKLISMATSFLNHSPLIPSPAHHTKTINLEEGVEPRDKEE